MPGLLILGALVAGCVVAGLCALWLRRRDPSASRTSLVLKSAALLPLMVAVLVALASLSAFVAGFGETGERGPWLTVYVASLLGKLVAVPAFIGGLVASVLIVWRKSP